MPKGKPGGFPRRSDMTSGTPPPRRPSPHAPLASSVGRVAPLRSTTCFRKLLRRRFPPCPRAPRIYNLPVPGIYTPAVPRLYPALQCPGAYLGSTQSFVFRRIAEISARFRRENDRTDVPHLFCFHKITTNSSSRMYKDKQCPGNP